MVQFVRDLKPGQEWHTPYYYLNPGRSIHVSGSGTSRFYLGVYRREFIERIFDPPPGRIRKPFPFVLTTDRFQHDQTFSPRSEGEFGVVTRLGIFNPPGRVVVNIEWL
jgi:hypothetical protein